MWIVGALEEAAVVGGMSALGAALCSIGIPNNSVVEYETEIKNDKLLSIAHGALVEVEHAKEILDRGNAETVTVHSGRSTVGVS
jgi:hypothetical protein